MKNIENGTIIDVRTQQEFLQEHYPGAINIPLDQVAQKADEFKKMKKPIIAYCRSGNRSGMAVAILKQNGITEVYNAGGLEDMIELKKH